MGIEVRSFRRTDREQVTDLVNAHVGAVLPGVSVSTNAVLSQLEREPAEFIVDPWVTERTTLVAVERDRVVAAAHLRRYSDRENVGQSFRNVGEIAWLLFWPDAPYWPDRGAGTVLAAECVRHLRHWGVGRVYADGALPAPAVYGVPDAWPHVRAIYEAQGLVHDGRIEVVVVASVDDLPVLREVPLVGLTVERRLGINGTRLSARVGDNELGFVEVSADMSRGSALSRYAGWADVGNFFVEDAHRRRGVGTWLLAYAAEWLRLGHVDRLLAYASEDEEAFLVFLVRNGFREVTRTRRGWVLPTV